MKKTHGFLIFELFLSLSLSAILFLMLYQVYLGVQKTLYYVEQEGAIEIQKASFLNMLAADIMQSLVPYNLADLYMLLYKYKFQSNDEQKKKQGFTIKKLYTQVKFYIPILQKTDFGFQIVFISGNQLFNQKNVVTKIYYLFKQKNHPLKQIVYYDLYRKEVYYDVNYQIVREGNEHLLVRGISDLKITFTLPDVSGIKFNDSQEQDKSKGVDQKNYDPFYLWMNKKMYQEVESYIPIEDIVSLPVDQSNFLYNIPYLPYSVNFNGEIYNHNFIKRDKFVFSFDFPWSDYSLQSIISQSIFHENNKKEVEKKST
jgi:hypothetical protein